MRILMTRPPYPNTLEDFFVRGLAGAPCEIHGVMLRQTGMAEREHLGRRLIRRFAPEIGFAEANRRLLAQAEHVKPDAIWIFKGMEVYPRTLRGLAASGITLVNYNADHPLLHASHGSGNRNVTAGIPLYHLHITYSRLIARQLEQSAPGPAIAIIPFGHEVSDTDFERVRDEPEILRVGFIGTPDRERSVTIQRFIDAGLPIDVYGFHWRDYLTPSPLLTINAFVTGEAMLRALRRYRVQINVFRPHNAESHNMRTFEVPAAGGIMLAQDSTEHREFFESGREAFYFSTPDEMIARARDILALPKDAADAARDAARRRSMTSGYTYADRARVALAAIEKVHRERRR